MSSRRAAEKFSLLRFRSTSRDNIPAADARHAATVQNRAMSKPGAAMPFVVADAARQINIDSRWFLPNMVTACPTPRIGFRGA